VAEGFVLLIIGMATVFAFLQLMVGIMNLSAKLFVRFAERSPEPRPSAGIDLAHIAVAIAAVKARTRN